MSTSPRPVFYPEITCNKLFKKTLNNNKIKHTLKPKENIFKKKCSKELKKKLKKYRLRRDGQEDQDVLDVSQILVSALKIKSPNSREENKVEDTLGDELRPKNYLFKMGRRKQITKTNSDSCNALIAKAKVSNTTPQSEKEDQQKSIKEFHRDNNVKNNSITTSYVQSSSTKENDKKQTNAFKLLMDSRNKSIGSNSPGKEKDQDDRETQEELEKRSAKAKRALVLQKMAEAKGSLKNKEIEDYQEKVIKKKMEKRAERLKDMILKNEVKPTSKDKNNKGVIVPVKTDKTKDSNVLKTNKLQLVNLFKDPIKKEESLNPKPKCASIEDTEFLKKLSPSLKKKENMLCYFKKVEKDNSVENDINDSGDEDNVIIKVKLTPKAKKKIKKKKLSLHRDLSSSDIQNNEIVGQDKLELNNSDKLPPSKIKNIKTSKENSKDTQEKCYSAADNIEISEVDIIRPRRNVKRPAKYIDQIQESSSDELHIFTPKKKKQAKNAATNDSAPSVYGDEIETKLSAEPKKEKKNVDFKKSKKPLKDDNQQKKPASKLAPIFNAKVQLDTAAVEAKQRFLSSGVPDKLKKVIEKQNYKMVVSNDFTTVVHVQQNQPLSIMTDEVIFNLEDSDEDIYSDKVEENLFKQMLKLDNLNSKVKCLIQGTTKSRTHIVLQSMKQSYPKFPVYHTYRLLKDKSRGEFRDSSFLDLDNSIEVINGMIDINIDSPDRLNWTDKYKPMSSKQIIGNFETIKEVKKWLISWTENEVKTKKSNNADSDSSDFYYSDTDSKDSMKVSNNLLILTGPVGSGKTSIVYAVAAELAIKVLEVNASSKRTGKIMLQDLQEATQSHKVNRGKSSSQDSSQKLQEIIEVDVITKPKKRGRPKKSMQKSSQKSEPIANEGLNQPQVSQDSTRTCMSLILIDDADIVFDQDDGFCSAIVQLVHSSKRPVILITSSATCPHLQRFLQIAKIMNTRPLLPKMLGTWLDIMCLVENNTCYPGIGARFLDYFKGDIRKTINYLQFYFSKETILDNASSENSDCYNMNIEDESSSMSWSDRECFNENNELAYANSDKVDKSYQYFFNEKMNVLHCHSIELFNLWWNIPRLLKRSASNLENKTVIAEICPKAETLEMQAISTALDMISISDCFRKKHFVSDMTDAPWLNLERDSVSEQQSCEKYNKTDDITNELSQELITGCIVNSQQTLEIENENFLQLPEIAVRRERDRTLSRHNNLTNYLSSSAALDRRALALDYWAGCRNICRIEKSKTDTHTKRNNRYCHYLKSLNVLCSNDSFDKLGNALCTSKD